MKLHKKGFYTDPLVDAWAFITYALIIIIFFVIFSFGKGEMKVEVSQDAGSLDYSVVLRDYLRAPYEDGTVADFIAQIEIVDPHNIPTGEDRIKKEEDYKKLEVVTTSFFNSQFPPKTGEQSSALIPPGIEGKWGVKIYDISKESVVVISNTGIVPEGEANLKYMLASQIIPSLADNYRVELWSESDLR